MKKFLTTLVLIVALVSPLFAEDIWFTWTPNPSHELVSNYRLEYKKLPAVTNWSLLTTVPATTNVAVVKGIQGGFVYQFRMFAINAIGTGTDTSVILQVPTNVPSAVTNFSTTAPR